MIDGKLVQWTALVKIPGLVGTTEVEYDGRSLSIRDISSEYAQRMLERLQRPMEVHDGQHGNGRG